MTRFSESTFTFSDVPHFYQIPVSCCEDQCYLNICKNAIAKIQDQKSLHSWTLPHPNYFTSPIVYANDILYCVINNNTLIQWSVNEDNLKDAETLKFQESVFAVLPVTGEQPLVLFNSGKCAFINGSKIFHVESPKFAGFKKNKKLLWADTSVIDMHIKVFCLALHRKENAYCMYYHIINKEEKFTSKLCKYIFPSKADIKCWCLNHFDSSFLSVCSNGSIYLHSGNNEKAYNILKLKVLETNAVAAVTCIDMTHIAIAVGNSNEKECTLEIWDTKFSVCKARKVLKVSNLNHLQITAKNSRIFVYVDKEILSLQFQVDRSTLASAVGKSVTNINKILEFSWDPKSRKLLEISHSNEPVSMDVSENNDDSLEIVAQRLLNQNSQYLMYIPESELIKLLKLSIKYNEEKNNSQTSSKKEASSIILNVVFSASFNDILLLKYLKQMSLDEILIILNLLLSFLNETIHISSPSIPQRSSDFQILNWTCLIIQSHMETLLLSKNKTSKKLLRKLQKALSLKMEEYEDYQGMQNYFTILRKKNILPEKSFVSKYCIETLDI